MDADQVVRIALTVVTPILTAGIGIVALVIGDWRERRTQAGRRKLSFEDASRQVAFAVEWWSASKLIAGSADGEQRAATQVQAWLDEATTLVSDSKPPPADEKQAITLRRLLLVGPMQRRSARILRAVFYFFLGVGAFQVSGALSVAFGRPETVGIPNYFSGGYFYGDLIAICVAMVVAMGFRSAALHIENSDSAALPHPRLTLRRALLLYRFRRPAANFARVVFWLWIVIALINPIAVVQHAFQEPQVIPGDLAAFVAFVGWAVGLRYWAVSLEERRRTNDPA